MSEFVSGEVVYLTGYSDAGWPHAFAVGDAFTVQLDADEEGDYLVIPHRQDAGWLTGLYIHGTCLTNIKPHPMTIREVEEYLK